MNGDKNGMNYLAGEKPIALGRDYDGIDELDNPLPLWWLMVFFATIIFSFLYMLHFHIGPGALPKEELASEMRAIQELQTKAGAGGPDGSMLAALAADPSAGEVGRLAFVGKCAACHGEAAQGGIGPNLTDEYWLHGKGTLIDIAGVIYSGVQEKGMPAWGSLLSPRELGSIAVFVRASRGTNPALAKAPQGLKVDVE